MLTKCLPIFALALLMACPAWAQDAAAPASPDAAEVPADEEQKPADPATATVEQGTVAIKVELTGHLESAKAEEVILRPEVWQVLEVEEAVPAGKRVKKGDVLIRLKTEDIDKKLKEAEADHRLSELALAGAEQEYTTLEKTIPMDLEANERTFKQFKEDYKQYQEHDLPYAIESAKWSLESAEFNLEYEMEELKQLQQMYEADEITEETEEIILTRQKRSVERAQRGFDRAKVQTKETLEVTIPRQQKQWSDNAIRAEINYKNTRETLPRTLEQKRIAYEKAVHAHEEKNEAFKNLRKDREMMVVKSPADGVVYYGSLNKGQPSGAAMQKKLEPRGKLVAAEVVMTIVNPEQLLVRTSIPEDKIRYFLGKTVQGDASVAAFPKAKLKARVKQVSPVPVAAGQFDATVEIMPGDGRNERIMPGLAAKLTFTPYENKNARLLPEKAVFPDENDDAKPFVYLVTGEGKHERRDVQTGEITDGKVEITKGLKPGDKVLLAKPEGK